jgi:hypothetical protein
VGRAALGLHASREEICKNPNFHFHFTPIDQSGHHFPLMCVSVCLCVPQGSEICFSIFLPALVMGNFLVRNLYLALLLNSFSCEELKSRKEVGNASAFIFIFAFIYYF